MHAVFVLPRFFPYRGGYENSMLEIAKCLADRGHRVTVFTTTAQDLESLWLPGYRTFPSSESSVEGVIIRRFPISYNKLARRATRFAGLLPYWRWKAQYWTPGFHVPGLKRALHSADADVFHVGPLPYNNLMYAGIEAAGKRRVPVIATPCTHLGEEGSKTVAQHYIQHHQIALLKHCDRVVCMTQTERSRLEALGVAREKLLVLGLGFDWNLATGGDGERIRKKYGIRGPVVVHLGMKAYEKGSQTVVEAMKLLWKGGSEVWLVMAGPSLRTFDEYVALSAPDCPRFINLPLFADEEKRDFLAAADVVVQPSRVESLGLVLFEAWANAKPVITADIAVSRELIEASGGGVLVRFDDAGQLAEQVTSLLADGEQRRKMGLHGKRFADQYEGEKMWTRYAEQFEAMALPAANCAR